MDKQIKSLKELLDSSGYKSQFIGNKLGFQVRATWSKKRNNPDSWTTEDVKRLAEFLQLRPVDIYEAIYYEVQSTSIFEVPIKEQ